MPSEGAIALIFAGSICCLLLLMAVVLCIMDAIDRRIGDKKRAAYKKVETKNTPD